MGIYHNKKLIFYILSPRYNLLPKPSKEYQNMIFNGIKIHIENIRENYKDTSIQIDDNLFEKYQEGYPFFSKEEGIHNYGASMLSLFEQDPENPNFMIYVGSNEIELDISINEYRKLFPEQNITIGSSDNSLNNPPEESTFLYLIRAISQTPSFFHQFFSL